MLYVWFAALMLHNLSRVTALYPALVAATSLFLFVSLLRTGIEFRRFVFIASTLAVTFYVLVLDTLLYGAPPALGNVVRLLTPAIATVLFCMAMVHARQLRIISLVFLWVVALAAGSIFYQVVMGPIGWFADASERAGLQRYASLLGSLTTFGMAAPMALLCAAMFLRNRLLLLAVFAALLLAGLMSLQKAALAGLLVSLPFMYALLERRVIVSAIVGGMALVIAGGLLLPADLLDYASAGWVYFVSLDSDTYDVSIASSALSRLVEYPNALFLHHGWDAMLHGVGLRGGSGIFGFTNEPMAHNAVVDYIAIGGVPYAVYGVASLLLVAIAITKVWRAARWRRLDRRMGVFVVGLGALYLINLPFASGLTFHPVFCWIPAALISFSWSLDRSQKRDISDVRSSVEANTVG